MESDCHVLYGSITALELQYLCSKLAEHNGQPLPIKKYAQASLENGIMKLLLSVSYPFEDPRRAFIDKCMSQVGHHLASSSPVAWAPSWLHTIAGYLPCSRVHSFKTGLRGIVGFIKYVHQNEAIFACLHYRDFRHE
ncbi:unnamed protein product [Ixodes persulcatus]